LSVGAQRRLSSALWSHDATAPAPAQQNVAWSDMLDLWRKADCCMPVTSRVTICSRLPPIMMREG